MTGFGSHSGEWALCEGWFPRANQKPAAVLAAWHGRKRRIQDHPEGNRPRTTIHARRLE
jgi:hypothetical protein